MLRDIYPILPLQAQAVFRTTTRAPNEMLIIQRILHEFYLVVQVVIILTNS
jgi:hypothetical protein